MTRRATTDTDDRLDEVLAEIERARHEPAWVPEPERPPRRLIGPPEALDGARWVPSRPAVALMVVCALIAVGILTVRMMLAGGGGQDAGSLPSTTSAASAQVVGKAVVATQDAGASTVASGSAPATTSAATAPLSIHVVGAVRHPGVVQVPAGSRVEDAVRAAGGMVGADSTAINLARPLADGEQVHVPRPGETVTAPAPAVGASGAPVPAGAPAASGGGVVNLNSADASALDALPGVGPVLAQRIIEWRTKNGRFSSVDELGEVSGIGDKALERLRSHVTV